MQLHLLKRLSHTSVEDDQNQWTCLNTSALNSTAQHTHTVQWKTVNAAIGCGIQIGGNGLEHHVNISTKWMLIHMRRDFKDVYGKIATVNLWGSSKIDWIAASCGQVAEVSACPSVLRWFESMSRQSVQRCAWDGGEDAWQSWRNKNEESQENGKRWGGREREDNRVPNISILSIWNASRVVMTGQARWISRTDTSTIPVTALFSSSAHKIMPSYHLHTSNDAEKICTGKRVLLWQRAHPQKQHISLQNKKITLNNDIYRGPDSSLCTRLTRNITRPNSTLTLVHINTVPSSRLSHDMYLQYM